MYLSHPVHVEISDSLMQDSVFSLQVLALGFRNPSYKLKRNIAAAADIHRSRGAKLRVLIY